MSPAERLGASAAPSQCFLLALRGMSAQPPAAGLGLSLPAAQPGASCRPERSRAAVSGWQRALVNAVGLPAGLRAQAWHPADEDGAPRVQEAQLSTASLHHSQAGISLPFPWPFVGCNSDS